MATAKQIALEIVQAPPDDCTLGDAAYRLYMRQLVARTFERAGYSPKRKSSGKPLGGSSSKVGGPSQG